MWSKELTRVLFTSKKACGKTGFDLDIFFFFPWESSNKANHILNRKQKICHSEVSDEGLSSHLSRNYKEKLMAAQLLKEIFLFFFKLFYILFLGLSYPELALSTEIHVILAVMEVLLQTKPNQSLPDTSTPWQKMAGRWQKQWAPPLPCQGCPLLAAGVCVRKVSVARASLSGCLPIWISGTAVSHPALVSWVTSSHTHIS